MNNSLLIPNFDRTKMYTKIKYKITWIPNYEKHRTKLVLIEFHLSCYAKLHVDNISHKHDSQAEKDCIKVSVIQVGKLYNAYQSHYN